MKRLFLSTLIVAAAAAFCAAQGLPPIKSLDVGLNSGAVFHGDQVGLSVQPEARVVFDQTTGAFGYDAGAGLAWHYTPTAAHTQNAFFLTLMGGTRIHPFADTPLAPLAVRANLTLAPGYWNDTNSAGTNTGVWGVLLKPAVGLQYPWQSFLFDLSLGYQLLPTTAAFATSATLDLGVHYQLSGGE